MLYNQMSTNPRQTHHSKFYGTNAGASSFERQTPVNYNDANDHRNYQNGPDLGFPPIGMADNGLMYNDFDYIGYKTRAELHSQINALVDSRL